MSVYDAVIIGSGPNGLAAGIALSQEGKRVLILEAHKEVGGGTRTAELTLPGFHHDVCSAVHPSGFISPFFKTLPLEKFGLEWIHPEVSVAHPLDNAPAILLKKSIKDTATQLGQDSNRWVSLFEEFVGASDALFKDTMAPLQIPNNPILLSKFGLKGARSAVSFVNSYFKDEQAKALFAGCAGHSILPFDKMLTSAFAMMFVIQGHVTNWPIVKGGSQNLAKALSGYFVSLGGTITTNTRITNFEQLPKAKAYLFDTDPKQLAAICKDELPKSYLNRLHNYKYGPGIFKVDWALSESIPWKDPNCLKASTVHVGGTFNEIAKSEKDMWEGRHSEKPFLILCQQSEFDATRAPKGQHTGYAYCHVPNGSTKDMTAAIESQIERFAPGFKNIILSRHKTSTKEFQDYNPNYLGGAITGGVSDISQLFTRPVARLNPYSTPNPSIYICSASSPPGGGVHGMCGYYAAKSVLNKKAAIKR